MSVQDVVVIGAGPAGLAVAGALAQRGRSATMLEKAAQVGSSWRNHYERLHLHTVKALSALPGLAWPDDAPRYVARQQVVDYLAAYADLYRVAPRFGEEVVSVAPHEGGWLTTCASGERYASASVVVATGANAVPNAVSFENEASFGGRLLHSRDYRNPEPFRGQRVVVVGMGNTGAEIALDLAEAGVATTLSVRSAVNIVRRDVLGRPTQLTALALARLPDRWGDALSKLLCDLTVGNLERHGLRRSTTAPTRQLREEGKTPVIDIGTLARIRRGDIVVRPGIERFTATGVRFVDGRSGDFDAVLLACGYRPDVEAMFAVEKPRCDERGLPVDMAGSGRLAGVYFVGFDVRQAGGLLRTIALQASRVADAICEPARSATTLTSAT